MRNLTPRSAAHVSACMTGQSVRAYASKSNSCRRDDLSFGHHHDVASTHVRYWGKSGKYMLVASFSQFAE
jgi:hypothetical protein